jgi:ketosteroid isomerase-like protein
MGPIVAQRLPDRDPRRRRTAEEQALARSPKLYEFMGRRIGSLDPGSALRKRLIAREVLSGWAASTRRDYELMLVRYAPDFVWEVNPELVTLGFPARIDGKDDFIRALEEFADVWSDWQFRLNFLIDLGDQLVMLGHAHFRGRGSGLEFDNESTQVIDLEEGIVVHERDYSSWNEALAAAGLGEDALAKLGALAPGESVEL